MAADCGTRQTIINGICYRAYYAQDEWIDDLPEKEIVDALSTGKTLRENSVKPGLRDTISEGPGMISKVRRHQIGCLPEKALRWTLGFDLRLPQQEYNVPDMPGKIQARLIGVDHYGLRVKPTDGDDWLVTGVVIERGKEREPCRLPGWCLAGEAKKQKSELRCLLARDLVC